MSEQTTNQSIQTTQQPTTVVPEAAQDQVLQVDPHIINSQEATVNLRKRLTILMEIGTGLTLGLIVINFLIIYLSNNQVSLYRANRQQIAAALYNSSDIQNTVSFLEAQRQQTEIINQALPNENGFIDFVRTLELIAGQHSQNSQFEFDKGQKDNELSYVPISISMTTDSTNLNEFLKKTEKLAYLFHINTIDATRVTDTTDLWQIKISARLYVNTKFRLNQDG